MNAVSRMMIDLGWTEPLNLMQESPVSFRPEVFKSGKAWEQDIDVMKQRISDEKNAHYRDGDNLNSNVQETPVHAPNTVKVVDKSYLERKFRKEGASELIDSTTQDFH